MARLPEVGGDSGNWGAVLNEYLTQSLTSDGSLKSAAIAPLLVEGSGVILTHNPGANTISITSTASGADGRSVELQNNGTHIQWRLIGDTSWTPLTSLAAITGPQGAQGAGGAQGAQGIIGAVGAQGVQGTAGAQGAIGSQGATGAQGSQGFQGTPGTPGAQGATGTQGSSGVQGATGTQGATGAQGPQGDPQTVISQAEAQAGSATTARAVSAASLNRDVNYYINQKFVVLEANDPAGTTPGVIYFRKAV